MSSTTPIKEYKEITEYGYIKDGKVILRGYFDFQDREIGDVRESDEESLKYFVNRFDMVTKKVQAVKDSIHTAENKGSYLMKLIHMRTYLATYNGLGDFTKLYEEINVLEDEINEYIAKNRDKNFEIKTALLKEAQEAKYSTEWKDGTERFKELKMNWIKTGSAVKEEEEKLSEQFNDAMEFFFKRRGDFYQEMQRIMRDRLFKYRSLLNQVKRINRIGGGKEFVNEVKDIQNEWREVGKVPKMKINKTLYEFKKETAKFFNDLKSQRSSYRRKSPIEMKKELLETAESFLKSGSPYNIAKIKTLQNDWKQLGKLQAPEDKEYNLRFRIICNEIFESHFLERMAKNLHPDLYTKSDFEQLKIKMDLLRDSIKQDESELYEFNSRHGSNFNSNDPQDYQLYQQRNNFINKLKTKKRILQKLEDKLLML
ncbi:DUF349 domain-containing protein [Sediminitomix flava]|uniref:Uncharacterized protein DUF349 n=1 Tax=Sediminitomix flava TaxID=379075 RepID=A0A315Z0H9_SEDFL|nr:DUF349 domain-containing protein [Sediminitomix flava]PWJ36052.1 uncharacterized protein DUF349 [Sediminitomix flava]